MDLQPFASQQFLDDDDPICNLNLKETSEFVKSYNSMSSNKKEFLEVSTLKKHDFFSNDDSIKRNIEAPPTPGRPIFSFSVGNFSKKSLPSKWDDAEKWLVSSGNSCNDSPASYASHHQHGSSKQQSCCKKISKQSEMFRTHHQSELLSEKFKGSDEKNIAKVVSGFHDIVPVDYHHYSAGSFIETSVSANVLLKDKFTNESKDSFHTFKCSEPMKEGFVFANNSNELNLKNASKMEDLANEVEHRDIGTEMTPIGSSTTSRCHTPFTCSSPARHNTPIDRSGPLAVPDSDSSSSRSTLVVDIAHQLQLETTTTMTMFDSNWSSRAEEEEEISKSLRHFEMMSNGCSRGKIVYDSKGCAWGDEDGKTNFCSRYQREEAKIQAWVNLENAKAEAESRKLEVKIQKMRSKMEEKLTKKMTIVQRKAEEWRTRAKERDKDMMMMMNIKQKKKTFILNGNKFEASCCACFSCNNNHHY